MQFQMQFFHFLMKLRMNSSASKKKEPLDFFYAQARQIRTTLSDRPHTWLTKNQEPPIKALMALISDLTAKERPITVSENTLWIIFVRGMFVCTCTKGVIKA